MFGSLGLLEIAAILLVLLVAFGHRRIPKLARDLGSGLRGLIRGIAGGSDDRSA